MRYAPFLLNNTRKTDRARGSADSMFLPSRGLRHAVFALFITAGIAVAEVANMSGTWVLNLERSRFGDNPRPANVVLTVQHNEPALKYSGTVNHPNEGHIIEFQFDGAIDGKPHVIKEDRGDRQTTFRRVNDRVVESDSKWADGEEKSRITISNDGRTMERRIEFRDREGKKRDWIEIYEKKR
jgi:hypothetical protein